MNPVVGLDISKGESQVQAFLDKGKPYRKSFKVDHTLEGLSSLVAFLEEYKTRLWKKAFSHFGSYWALSSSCRSLLGRSRIFIDYY